MVDMSSPPLVLLHAYPLDARMWDSVRAPLAERTRLITPDQRGLGRSPMPDGEDAGVEPNLDHAARDVLALLDRLGLDKVVLGGCSMGGYVTFAMLRLAPERIAGLVLIDTKAGADAEEARANRLEVARRAETEGTAGWLADQMVPKLLGETTRARRPGLVERVRELIEQQPPSGVAWAQRAMAARGDATELLRSVAVPTVVITGEEDVTTPPETARELAAAVPNAELVLIPEAGHLSPLEASEAVVDAVARVLG
ncbi:putative hydrolase or acyltransferase of alpha/beta superfamily [Saccharomonospora glauca K62]|uniref:Putative hydrolase or acyltransferase of alpha/beta superfamily n=2 Tax=Saccharomonospora glauca TaxID=40990 RepID=I1D5F6_9PSEU|nr:putative hydrolase or acyltransferase of alpha/beta superfamily [Saccharomonospora glauca K62]